MYLASIKQIILVSFSISWGSRDPYVLGCNKSVTIRDSREVNASKFTSTLFIRLHDFALCTGTMKNNAEAKM